MPAGVLQSCSLHLALCRCRSLSASECLSVCFKFWIFVFQFQFQLNHKHFDPNYSWKPNHRISMHPFLLLARYVPNVAKRSIWEQCKKKYILRTDRRPATGDQRPATDRRPTDLSFGQYWGNFKWPYLREGSSDPVHVWLYVGVFGVGESNGANSGLKKKTNAIGMWEKTMREE